MIGRAVAPRVRLGALLVAPLPLCVLLLLAAAGTPGYRHGAETISALGAPGRPMALLARAAIVGYGLVVLVGSLDLGGRAPDRPRALRGAVAIYGIGAVAAGLFPKVLPGQTTTASHVHVIAALAGGAALLVAMYAAAAGGPSTTERVVAAAAGVVVAVGSVVFRQTWGTDAYGIAERVVLGAGVAWLSWAAWCAIAELHARVGEVTPRP